MKLNDNFSFLSSGDFLENSEQTSFECWFPPNLHFYLILCMLCCVLSFSVVSNSLTPWTVAHQAPLSMGFSRQEYWSALPFPSPVKWFSSVQYTFTEYLLRHGPHPWDAPDEKGRWGAVCRGGPAWDQGWCRSSRCLLRRDVVYMG